MPRAIANWKKARQIFRRMEKVSRRIIFTTLPDTRRAKPLTDEVLGLSYAICGGPQISMPPRNNAAGLRSGGSCWSCGIIRIVADAPYYWLVIWQCSGSTSKDTCRFFSL
jgi:hypothetical protein